MGKYTDQAAIVMRTLNYYYPHAAFMHFFEDLLREWDKFDALWRLSYGPPIQNQAELGDILAKMHEIQSECKTLYNNLRINPSGGGLIQTLPPLSHIEGPANDEIM